MEEETHPPLSLPRPSFSYHASAVANFGSTMHVAPPPSPRKQVIIVAISAAPDAADSVSKPVCWVLKELARPGDVVLVLAALRPSPSTFRLASEFFNYNMKDKGTVASMKVVNDKVERRRKEIDLALSSVYKASLEKQVKLYLDVRRGKIKALGIGHAMMLKATHVVLGRELKMYRKHFIEHLPCTIILLRRKHPPRTFQGVQGLHSSLLESTEFDLDDDLSSCLVSHISTSQSSPRMAIAHNSVQIPDLDTQLFSLEIAKQPLDNWVHMLQRPLSGCAALHMSNAHAPFVISQGSALFQGSLPQPATDGQMTSKSCSSCCGYSSCSAGQALHYDRLIASSATSTVSSFRSLPTVPNNMDFTTLQSHMQELAETSLTKQDALAMIDPTEIQENVKEVISVQPSRKHTSRSIDSLMIEEGPTSDDYPVFGQEKQSTTENDSDKSHQQQANDEASKSMSLEEKSISESELIDFIDLATSFSVSLQPEEEPFSVVHEGRKNSALACPFCSVRKQSPVNLGKRPIKFSHGELLFATNGFSRANLLGEDDASLVYKGLLKDGHHITIKKFKEPCVSEDDDRLFEVQLLMCAQHRNLVMLLGYCNEESHFMLVYEYACNMSLSWHLSKKHNPDGLQWWARRKIAVGVARALRYLHEECRAGSIVHRDIRAQNIFLTHEFVPLVGNFGLAYFQQDKVVGDAGRDAVSCKSDVYAFGIVLLELITGKQSSSDNFNLGFEQQSLVDWAQPLLLDGRYHELLDSRLESSHDSFELICMVRAALMCIIGDPSSRPKLGQVMRVLEGGNANDDEPLTIEFSLCDELSLAQRNQQTQENPKLHHVQSVTSSTNSKPKRKFKGPSLTYDEMLH